MTTKRPLLPSHEPPADVATWWSKYMRTGPKDVRGWDVGINAICIDGAVSICHKSEGEALNACADILESFAKEMREKAAKVKLPRRRQYTDTEK